MTSAPDPLTTPLARRMVSRINPDWRVRDTTQLTGGHHPVAEVTVDTAGDQRRFVLKATEADGAPLAATEARVLRYLENESTLPVPELFGAVDDHEGLPTPFFLMERLPGTKHPRTELGTLDEAALSTLARSAGRQLAELHEIAGFDAFGRVTHRRGEPLDGGRPAGTLDVLTLDEPFDDWQAAITEWGEQALEALEGGPFDELVADLSATLADRITELESPQDPVLAHIDWSLDNVLVDQSAATITGLPDWEFTMTTSPGYDIVYAAHSLAGGPWYWVPAYPDRRDLIRDHLIAGYRASATSGRLSEFHANEGTYALLNMLHAMIHTVDRLELDGATPDQIDGAIDRLRAHAEGITDD